MSIRMPESAQPTGYFAALERTRPADASPFDRIRRVRLDGSEYWSARDLMPLMGYSAWRNFGVPLQRAMMTAQNQGHDVQRHFARSRKVAASGPDAEDCELSRFAAYLVAMNGDPNKPEVAAAQAYFAIRTREAETVTPALSGPELLAHAVIEAQKMLAAKDERIAELEPKAEFYDALMEADGTYSMLAASKILGWGRNVMMRELRRAGVLQGNNLPYQRYAHHFKVVPGTYTHPRTGEQIPTATTYVRPSGLEFLRRKLDRSPVVVS
ncbi:phage antirepressor KilAC domain-containing protein [Mycobacterium heckeshornense]|uniref:phage antirepressor KilAC domain-containing protein n=1 Tax=Mycobacterium heckeshornense TaxID=110505 RepID=UPI00069E57B9|nr:phage antirepressor KilAC domain-containing protein [Mycobacterium heckeshornense]